MTIHEKMVHEISVYCQRIEKRAAKGKDHFSASFPALMLDALERAENEAAERVGAFAWSDRLRDAIVRNFNEPIASKMIRAIDRYYDDPN